MIIITSERIRSIVSDCKTEQDIISALRSHKVKYSFTTETGYLSIRIPCKTGTIRIYRTCSRSNPFVIQSDNAFRFQYPIYANSWNS